MIRDAVEADIPAMVEMGREHWDASGFSPPITFDPESAAEFLREIISGQRDGFALVALSDDGRLIGQVGGVFWRHYYNLKHTTGNELFWRATEGCGAALFRAMHRKLTERKPDSFFLAELPAMDGERVGHLYERAGYRLVERVYVKGF